MHYYSHHIGDYQRDTSDLAISEHGVYRLLMDAYYVTERPLPADHATLCRMCRAMSKLERDAVSTIMTRFFREENGLLHHKRIESDIRHYQSVAIRRSECGRLGGRPKKQPESDSKANGLHLESKTQATQKPSSTQEPGTINQEPALKPSAKAETSAQTRARAGSFPSVDEVKTHAELIAAPADCAERFWNDCEAVGWVNRHGQPIADWRPLFRNFATQWRANAAQQQARQNNTASHPNSHRHDRHTPPHPRSDSANRPGRYATASQSVPAAAASRRGAAHLGL